MNQHLPMSHAFCTYEQARNGKAPPSKAVFSLFVYILSYVRICLFAIHRRRVNIAHVENYIIPLIQLWSFVAGSFQARQYIFC